MSDSSAIKSFDLLLVERCLSMANHLITKSKAPVPAIHSTDEIDSNLIVLLFEKITNLNVPDLLSCVNKTEEAHNVQAVIDTLSLDLIGISLSHITGEAVVAGNLIAISDLLEVLNGVSFYLKSDTINQRAKEPNLKRKICRKRKSELSSSKPKSIHRVNSHLNGVTNVKNQNKKDRNTLSQPHPLDDLLEQLKKRRPRRLSSRIRQSQSLDKSGISSSVSQHLDESSVKSPPPKLFKCSDRKITSVDNKELSDELDHKPVINSQRWSQHHFRHKSIQDQTKAHFHVEPVDRTKNRSVQDKREAMSTKNAKRKTFKPLFVENPEKPVEKKEEVEKLYEKNLEKKIRVIVEKNSYLLSRASHMKKLHIQAIRKPLKKSTVSSCKKSFLLPHTLRHRSASRTALKRISTTKNQFLQKQHDNRLPQKSKPGFIQELFEEFPGLHLSSAIVNRITKKYQQHLMKMHKKAKDCLLKKPKTQIQAEETAVKQSALSNILKKDIQQQQYLREIKENKKYESKMNYHLRDARMQSAKMKQYCDEFQTEMRKKMQKRNATEEVIFEKVFEDALKMQKDQVDHLCKEVKETGENDARKHLIYLDALENLYQTQFAMMSETLASEKQDTEDRIRTEKQEMNAMQREFQEELKQEIRFMQRAIIECTEDTHFRELDADLYRRKLRKKLS